MDPIDYWVVEFLFTNGIRYLAAGLSAAVASVTGFSFFLVLRKGAEPKVDLGNRENLLIERGRLFILKAQMTSQPHGEPLCVSLYQLLAHYQLLRGAWELSALRNIGHQGKSDFLSTIPMISVNKLHGLAISCDDWPKH
jgi:hypothetical protein